MQRRVLVKGGLRPLVLCLSLGLSNLALAGGVDHASGGTSGGCYCGPSGSMQYGAVEHSGELRLWDKPLGYSPLYGPDFTFALALNPTEPVPLRQATSLGGWGFNGSSYVTTVPPDAAHPDGAVQVYGRDGGYEVYRSASACSASDPARCEYPLEGLSKNGLIRFGGDRSAFAASATHAAVPASVQSLVSDAHGFVRVSPNGGYEIFGGRPDAWRAVSQGSSVVGYEAWLSAVVDRSGLVLQYRYQSVNGILRLTDVGDATIESANPPIRSVDGTVTGSRLGWTHLYYPDSDPRYQSRELTDWVQQLRLVNPTVLGLVTAVEDPYGHQAQLEYRDLLTGVRIDEVPEESLRSALRDRSQQFRLITSRDVLGVESRIHYVCGEESVAISPADIELRRANATLAGCLDANGGLGEKGLWVSSTETPYGMTKYQRIHTDTMNGGEVQKERGYLVTTPGGVERWEAVFGTLGQVLQAQLNPLLGSGPGTRPSHIPENAWRGLLTRPSSEYRLSFHWAKKAMEDLSNPTDPNAVPTLDHAHIRQYLHDHPMREGGAATQSPILAWEKAPLEGGIYYAYPGAVSADTYRNSSLTGETTAQSNPMLIARVLDDGTTQASYITYNEQGNPLIVVDPLGRAIETVYAANGIDATDTYQARWDASRSAMPGYGREGATRLERLGHYEINPQGQVTRAEGTLAIDGVSYGYETSAPYRLNRITQPLGESRITYSVMGSGIDRVERITQVSADGLLSTAEYQHGYLLQSSSAGRTRSFGDRDAFGRPSSVSIDGEVKVRYRYEGLDLKEITNAIDGSRVKLQVDYLGRVTLTQVIDHTGSLVKQSYQAYDASGGIASLLQLWDGYVGWEYDIAGRVKTRIDMDGSSQSITYEQTTSRIHATTDALGTTTYLNYDLANALTAKRIGSETAIPVLSLHPDSVYFRMRDRTDALGTTRYTYDPIQPYQLRTIEEPLPRGTSGATRTITNFTFDERNRNSGWNVTDDASSTAQSRVALGFDDSHQGRINRYTTEQFSAYPSYDAMDNLTQFGELNSIGYDLEPGRYPSLPIVQAIGRSESTDDRRINRRTYQMPYAGEQVSSRIRFDRQGRINRVEGLIQDGAREYAYNDQGEVTRASLWRGMTHRKSEGYVYDDLGNRKQVLNEDTPGLDGSAGAILSTLQSAEHGASNRLSTIEQLGMARQDVPHDAAGNIEVNPLRNQSYVRDAEGHLTEIHYGYTNNKQPSKLSSDEGGLTRFSYDGLGNIRRIEELDGFGHTLSDHSYVWLNGQLIQKRDTQTHTIKELYNADGQTVVNPDGSQTKYLLLKDYLGSVIGKTDTQGHILERVDYDTWGQIESRQVRDSTGNLIDADTNTTTLPFGYGNYWLHQRSGLNLTHFRQYDAKLGRWLSKDPIGELGGVNLYRYVNNSPINATDPSGLVPYTSAECEDLARRIEELQQQIDADKAAFRELEGVRRFTGFSPYNKRLIWSMIQGTASLADVARGGLSASTVVPDYGNPGRMSNASFQGGYNARGEFNSGFGSGAQTDEPTLARQARVAYLRIAQKQAELAQLQGLYSQECGGGRGSGQGDEQTAIAGAGSSAAEFERNWVPMLDGSEMYIGNGSPYAVGAAVSFIAAGLLWASGAGESGTVGAGVMAAATAAWVGLVTFGSELEAQAWSLF